MTPEQDFMAAMGRHATGRRLVTVWPGKVLRVDAQTVDVEAPDGAEVFGVRLRATIDGDDTGVVVVPVVGSYVIVAELGGDGNEQIVVQYSAVSRILILTADGAQIEMREAATISSSAGGAIQVGERLALRSSTDDLKSVLLDLITAIRAITVTTPTGPSVAPLLNDTMFNPIVTKLNNLLD